MTCDWCGNTGLIAVLTRFSQHPDGAEIPIVTYGPYDQSAVPFRGADSRSIARCACERGKIRPGFPVFDGRGKPFGALIEARGEREAGEEG